MTGCNGNTIKKKQNGKLRITTSFYVMYDFAKKIGGDKVEVIKEQSKDLHRHLE